MKTSKRNKLLCLALAGSCSLFGVSNALAAAGDTISNRATLNYDVGGVAQTLIESGSGLGNSNPGATNGNNTDFLEDRVVAFTVADTLGTGNVTPGSTLQATAFTVQNSSNVALDFLLRGSNNIDGTVDPQGGTADEFDGSAVQTFVESGATAGFQAAEDTAIFIPSLAPAGSAIVYVVSTIPLVDSGANPLVNTNVAVMTLDVQPAVAGGTGDGTGAIMRDDNGNVSPGGAGFSNGGATLTTVAASNTADDPTVMDTVYNDPGVTKDGQDSAVNSYTVLSAALTVTKASAALWDIVNLDVNPKSIPGGSVIRYTVTVENAAGAADAALTTIVDDLPLSIDAQFGDGTAANAPVSGASNVRITDGLGAVVFCQADPGDAAPTDGCDSALGGTADRLSVDLAAVPGITNVLQAAQTLTIEFDVVLP
ncbi:MAG TPA: hypothetical protein ENJ87_13235 [Gammaproteobacteria bacterium]|nr:hypothetical protein [Gammaproteobacteria bacterium]